MNGRCLVKWSKKDTLEATVIAMGEKSEMTNIGKDMMNKDIENLEKPMTTKRTQQRSDLGYKNFQFNAKCMYKSIILSNSLNVPPP